MDHTLSTKTAEFMSLENLYECGTTVTLPADSCTLGKLADNTAHKKFMTSGAN